MQAKSAQIAKINANQKLDLKDHSNLVQTSEIKFSQYRLKMEKLGKNWKNVKNSIIAKILKIPIELVIELKKKYCPYTKKLMKRKNKLKIIKDQI